MFGLCLTAQAQDGKEVWEIEAVGIQGAPILTAQFTRIGEHLYIDVETLLELGFPKNKLDRQQNYKLDDLGTTIIDREKGTIRLEVATALLPPTEFNLGRREQSAALSPTLPELVVNYEANASTEASASSGLLLDSSYYLSGKYRLNVQGSLTDTSSGTGNKWTRHNTSISYADPDEIYSWTLGDAVSANGEGINPVTFTGFQFKKDYTLQPGFVIQPVTELRGSASLPSVIDVFMDNRRVLSNHIPAGPFSISNVVPQVGANDARIVVRDSFGQEQIITQSLLGAFDLLRSGISNYGIQGGKLRTGSDKYDGLFASGFYSYGLTNTITVEANAEGSKAGDMLPAVKHIGAAVFTATPFGSLSLRGRVGTGKTLTAGYGNAWRDGDRSASFNIATTKNSRDYRVLGSLMEQPLRRTTINGSIQWDRGRSLNLYGIKDERSSNMGLSVMLSPVLPYKPYYMMTLDRSDSAGRKNTSVMFSVNMPFNQATRGRTQNLSASTRYQDGSFIAKTVDFSNSTMMQTGINYHLRADAASAYKRFDGDATRLSYQGEQHMAVSSFNGKTDMRGRIRGSALIGKNGVNFSRWISGGYSRVQADVPDTDVLINGTAYGRTNKDGVAYVPILSTYTTTVIRMDPNSDTSVDATPTNVAVRQMGGALARFERITGTLLAITGVESGTITINNEIYPITDRGAYVELSPGAYKGTLNNGRKIDFVIPNPGKKMVQHVTIK